MSTGAVTRHLYVESTPEAKVDRSVVRGKKEGKMQAYRLTQTTDSDPAALDAMLLADTLIVRAGGKTRDRDQVLDYYQVSTGRYLHSRRLPFQPIAIAAAASGVFYLTDMSDDWGAVIALTPRATKPLKTTPRKP